MTAAPSELLRSNPATIPNVGGHDLPSVRYVLLHSLRSSLGLHFAHQGFVDVGE